MPAMRDLSIDRVMTTPPVVVDAHAPLEAARALMAEHRFHHLPVVRAGRLVGILGAAELAGAAPGLVADAMQPDPVSVPIRARLREAAAILGAGSFHSLPVTAPGGAIVGVVTSTDLIRLLVDQLPTTAPDREPAAGATRRFADADELARAVLAAERRHVAGDDPEHLAAALLYLDAKARNLEAVLRAADLYLHSGQGEREHTALVRAVGRAKEAIRPDLQIGRA